MMRRVLHAWADGAAAIATVLRDTDPSWGSETFEIADGRAVLWGPGLYVNRALALGIDEAVSTTDFEMLEHRSRAVGVPAAIESTSVTQRSVTALAARRGYVQSGSVIALRRDLSDSPSGAPDGVTVGPAEVSVWQAVSAAGWGHADGPARRASDAFAAAVATVDGDGFVLAADIGDGRPIGCATMSMHGGIATLAGMSTLPGERRRGVQTALVLHRLRLARAAGCVVATATTAPGGASERNLRRLGFETWFEITTLVRRPDPLGWESPGR